MLEDHCAGKGDYSRKLWTVLMFMLWHQINVENVYSFGNEWIEQNGTSEKAAFVHQS
jgi:asparagine synthase (glutamine-hydrolysing)